MKPQPSVGRIVHYVSYGTPGGEYASECRAAIVTRIPIGLSGDNLIDLAVLNPTGMFFNRCPHDEETKAGGSWHWPELVDRPAPPALPPDVATTPLPSTAEDRSSGEPPPTTPTG